jgi:hypothetical protein
MTSPGFRKKETCTHDPHVKLHLKINKKTTKTVKCYAHEYTNVDAPTEINTQAAWIFSQVY